jgi:CubicO group peptidase (beta-lactamase class C family)
MRDPTIALPETLALLEQGRPSILHPGAQLYVSLRGDVLADAALGEARPGVAMLPETPTLWLSSGKPITAVAIAQLVERGRLEFDDRVSRHLPEFAQGGKDGITIRHLLTHTAGFREADKLAENLAWDEMIARICATPLEAEWNVGAKAGYQTMSSWFILGELIRRVDGREAGRYVRENIFEPLGMRDSWMGIPADQIASYGDRMALMYYSGRTEFRVHPFWNAAEDFAACRPGSGVRGPMRELGRFYEALLDVLSERRTPSRRVSADIGEEVNAESESGAPLRWLKLETLRDLTRRHREGLFDHTFQHTLDLGLGFIVNSNRHGAETVPYGYGRHASEATFGHGGSQSSCAFADPEHQLVVAWHCNGQPGEPRHQRRAREINSMIYQELGLA